MPPVGQVSGANPVPMPPTTVQGGTNTVFQILLLGSKIGRLFFKRAQIGGSRTALSRTLWHLGSEKVHSQAHWEADHRVCGG